MKRNSFMFKLFTHKGFWALFATLSLAHIMEDMVWAVLARYTTIHIGFFYEGSDPNATTRYHIDNIEVTGN